MSGVYWLAAADAEPPVSELDLPRWREELRLRVKLLATTARVLYDQLQSPDRFFVSATRMGGRHGYDADGAQSPMGGAVSGFTKALGRERDAALVKVVDVESDAGPGGGRWRPDRRNPLRPGGNGNRPAGWPSLLRGSTGARGPSSRRWTRARQRHRFRRDGRCGQHRIGHHSRPGSGFERDVPPARPGPRACPGRRRLVEIRVGSRWTQARTVRAHESGWRAGDPRRSRKTTR